MEKKMTIIKQTDKKLVVFYWRERFVVLSKEYGDFDLRDLGKVDDHFLTATGKATLSNVKRGAAGLVPTMLVVNALDLLIKKRAKSEISQANVLRKQKLVMT
jgi:hypothetical protein